MVGLIAWVLLRGLTPQLMGLSTEPLDQAIGHSAALTGYSLLVLVCGLAVIAAIDVPFQLWQHAKDLRMTREEVSEEYKESEGSPETRGRIREAQRALARGRMLQEVPTADVVVTNPTHFAVALRYDEKQEPRAHRRRQGHRAAGARRSAKSPPKTMCRSSRRRRWRARCTSRSRSAAKCRRRCT